jgi:hypothetical protein
MLLARLRLVRFPSTLLAGGLLAICLGAVPGLAQHRDELPEESSILFPAAFRVEPVIENAIDASSPGWESSRSGAPTNTARYSAEWVGKLAAAKAPLGSLLQSDYEADRAALGNPSKSQRRSLEMRRRSQEFLMARQSQLLASKAMEIHFGIATIEAAENIQLESQAELKMQQARQDSAVDSGIGILDPSRIARLTTALADQQTEARTKTVQLRSQLSLLVDPSIACGYLAEPMEIPPCPPPVLNNCDLIAEAFAGRPDLQGLVYLRSQLTIETLDVARWISDSLTRNPASSLSVASGSCFCLSKLFIRKNKHDEEVELCHRLALLDKAIATLRENIASEVDIAIEKQRSAAERYCLAVERIEAWRQRIEQLRQYGDQVRPLFDEEAEAISGWYQTRGEAIQRQGDWHQAIVQLATAVGSIP